MNCPSKPGIAPCGHVGEFIIGTFVKCNQPGCDGLAPGTEEELWDDDKTPVDGWFDLDLSDIFDCPKCQSSDTEPFPHQIPDLYHCVDCGNVWKP